MISTYLFIWLHFDFACIPKMYVIIIRIILCIIPFEYN